jgi:hypothetical protein
LKPFEPYSLAGWRVLSDLELPELLPWPDAEPEVRPLRIEVSGRPSPSGPNGFEPLDNGGARLRVAQVALFEMSPSGDHVAVHPCSDADPLLLRTYIYGSVLAVLCYLRGLLPLHGASVLIGGHAVVLSGPRGAGKSTLAAALARRGHPLLSDDVSPLDLTDPANPMLWPVFPRVKLLEDAVAAFRLDAATTYSRAPLGTKGHFGMAAPALVECVTRPVRLGGVFALDQPNEDSVSSVRLRASEAFVFLDSQAHRARMGRRIGAGPQIFRQICDLAAAVPVRRVTRPCDLERLQESVELVETAMNVNGKEH